MTNTASIAPTNSRTTLSKWLPLVVFLTAVLAASLSWVILKPAYLTNASLSFPALTTDYRNMVETLLDGQGIQSFRYPPAFSLILAGIYELSHVLHCSDRILLAVFILIAYGLSAVLLFLMARLLWKPMWAGIAAALWISYLPALYSTSIVASETPFIVFLYASVLLLLYVLTGRRFQLKSCLFSGFLLGLAMLTRPIGLALILIFPAFLWFGLARASAGRRRVFLIAALLAGAALPVLPWEIYAYSRLERIIVLSTGDVPSILDGLTYGVDPKEKRQIDLPTPVRELQEDIYKQQYRELNSLGSIMSYLVEQLGSRPLTIIHHFVIKALNSWYRTDSSKLDNLLLVLQLPYILVFALGSVAAWRQKGLARKITIISWIIVLYFWLMTTFVLSILRYMLPAVGLLFLLVPAARYLRFPRIKQSKVHVDSV